MTEVVARAATRYIGVFCGRPDQVSRVRHEVARHLAGHPATDDAVLIMGSGLTMVDYVLSLLRAGHRGPITGRTVRRSAGSVTPGLWPRKRENTKRFCYRK